MNYNFTPLKGFETKTIANSNCKINSIRSLSDSESTKFNVHYNHEYPELASNRIVSFEVSMGTKGVFDFPQLVLQCPAREILQTQDGLVEWKIGGCTLTRYDFNLLRCLQKNLKIIPFKEIISFAAVAYKILKKARVFESVAKSIVYYALLQHKHWHKYVWMISTTHEFEQLEQQFKVDHYIPLCLPFGSERVVPTYQNLKIDVHIPLLSLSSRPYIQLLRKEPDFDTISVHRLVNKFEMIDCGFFDAKSDSTKIYIAAFHVGYCFLLQLFNEPNEDKNINIDFFALSYKINDEKIDAISGPLQPVAGCEGWYAIMSDEKLTFSDVVNMNTLPNSKTNYLNLTSVEDIQLVLSNKNKETLYPCHYRLYWQYINILRDNGGMCGFLFD